MYRIDYDPAAKCLTISVKGFFSAEDIPAFSNAVDAATRAARAQHPDFDTIIESLEFAVQAHDVADLLTGVMVRTIDNSSGRVAVLVGSQLNKAQVERTLVHPRVRPFMSWEEAEAWLSNR